MVSEHFHYGCGPGWYGAVVSGMYYNGTAWKGGDMWTGWMYIDFPPPIILI